MLSSPDERYRIAAEASSEPISPAVLLTETVLPFSEIIPAQNRHGVIPGIQKYILP